MEFYEKVRIKDGAAMSEYVGMEGVIGGVSDGADGITYYAVKFPDDETVMFAESELIALGEKITEEEMFPGGSVKIAVDEHGHGEIVEDNPPAP